MKAPSKNWTNKSVLTFAGSRDPVEAIVQTARDAVLEAIDEGWSGPPFDPMKLAELRGIPLIPSGDIRDARIVPAGQNRFVIEFNPNRPAGRMRYSIAHEIAHTFFSDCGERVRNRSPRETVAEDESQLEALCNIAAAEMLMPVSSLGVEEVADLKIDTVVGLRDKFRVSTEAILIRLAHLSLEPCAAFVASRREASRHPDVYQLDYAIPTRTWPHELRRGTSFPERSPLSDCTAIGFTASGEVTVPELEEKLHVECTGIGPYPGAVFPRVAGFLCSRKKADPPGTIRYVKGDALRPRSEGPRVIAHVVSDSTPNWGGRGFAVAVKRRWPSAQDSFRSWSESRKRLHLGDTHLAEVESGLYIASMVCQRGYGPSAAPRIRYSALEKALDELVDVATRLSASIHMPRIGCGQAGGSWLVIEELISSTLLRAKVPVTVYDLPEGIAQSQPGQLSFAAG